MTPTQRKSNELKISRFYEAPLAAVWEAWTDPKQIEQWWGPRGFTLTTHSKELKVGGHWHYTMHGPDGKDYPNKTRYLDVEDQAKLVYDHGANDERAPLFRVTVLFSAAKGGTQMDMTMTLPTAKAAEETKQFIKKAGGNATWDRLSEFVEKKKSGKETFAINRTFEAPIDVIYDMWTNPKHFAQWLPPTGFNMTFITADIRSGGSTFYSMTAQNGSMTMYGRANYLKMEKPHTLIYTQQFCDQKGNLARHPMAPVWPETLLTTVKLTAEAPDQTRVSVIWEPTGPTNAEEIDAFIKLRAGMTQGWTGSFDSWKPI